MFEATGSLKSRDCIKPARRVLKVSSALVETAASIAVAATLVGAATTILVKRNKSSEAIEVRWSKIVISFPPRVNYMRIFLGISMKICGKISLPYYFCFVLAIVLKFFVFIIGKTHKSSLIYVRNLRNTLVLY